MKNIFKLTLFVAFLTSSLFGEKLSIATGLEFSFYEKSGYEIMEKCENEINITENINTIGGLENIRKLLDHKVNFALVQLDELHYFKNSFDSNLSQKIKIIAPLFYEIIVLAQQNTNSKITKLSDLDNTPLFVIKYNSGYHITSMNFKKILNLKWIEIESSLDSKVIFELLNPIFESGKPFTLFAQTGHKMNPEIKNMILPLKQNSKLDKFYKYDSKNETYQVPAILIALNESKNSENIKNLEKCIQRENLSQIDKKEINWELFNFKTED